VVLLESFFMIRNGNFGVGFEVKLVMSIAAVCVAILDWRLNHRRDYVIVFVFGTVIWGSIELLLQYAGTREIVDTTLFGAPLAPWLSALLRGTSEGATIAILGISAGDLLLNPRRRASGTIGFATVTGLVVTMVIMQAKPARDVGGDVASRRDMLTPATLVFLAAMVVVDIVWLWKAGVAARRRGLFMLIVMVAFSGIWTLAEYAANTRWIEMGTLPSLVEAAPLEEFAFLAWDVVVEIGLTYLPYLAIPCLLKMIRLQDQVPIAAASNT
jgi:hypothetical protein